MQHATPISLSPPPRKVALFIPCLVDQVYPEMGVALLAVLRHLGLECSYDPRQTCCGQPAFNAGHHPEAKKVANQWLSVFQDAECVVCPSGSCTSMVRCFYPELLAEEACSPLAAKVGPRVFEFSEFMVHSGLVAKLTGELQAKVALHPSCHGYRELRLSTEPGALLKSFRGLTVVGPPGEPVCCGFGGLFSVKHAGIAGGMAGSRLKAYSDAGAEVLVVNDPGCIMHLRGEAAATGVPLRIVHLVQLVAAGLGCHEPSRAAVLGLPQEVSR